uniref:Uncharacterized protein n=1 Tax=Leersia perrieri TaxID=77586 RepID=A0A0D9XU40_9ORYZ
MPPRDDRGAARWGRWRCGQCHGIAGVDGIDGLHRGSDGGSVNRCSRRALSGHPCTVCTVAAKCLADPASGKLTTTRNAGVHSARSDKALQGSIEGIDRSENAAHCSAVVVAEIYPNLAVNRLQRRDRQTHRRRVDRSEKTTGDEVFVSVRVGRTRGRVLLRGGPTPRGPTWKIGSSTSAYSPHGFSSESNW